MGAYYELKMWLGKNYIVYQDNSTKWRESAKEIPLDKYDELERLQIKHDQEMRAALIKITEEG